MKLNSKHSLETIEKMRKIKIGKKLSEETKTKLIGNKNALGNRAFTGRKHTQETIEKIKETKRKNPFVYTEEINRKIGESGKGRIPWNKGLKGVMIAWNKGLTKYNNDSVKKIAESKLGRKKTDEQIKRMSLIGKERIKQGIALPPNRKGIKFTEEQKAKLRGPFSSNWLGGKSFEPYDYEFNKRFKQLIKIRDGFMCQKCNMLEEDSKQLFKKSLHVHHVDYNKQLSIPENCVTLCVRCHIETNANREAWKSFYQIVLSNKYGYKYSEGNVLIDELRLLTL